MADAITIKALQDASLDAKSLEEVVNGNESKQVTTRKGETYPSVKKAIKTLFESGGIAGRFKTLTELESSGLVDGSYALVADDTELNNGIYIKSSDTWVKSKYDPFEYVRSLIEHSLSNETDIVIIKDKNGTTTYKATQDGKHYFVGLGTDLATALSNDANSFIDGNAETIFEVKDIAQNTTLKQLSNGDLILPKIGNLTDALNNTNSSGNTDNSSSLDAKHAASKFADNVMSHNLEPVLNINTLLTLDEVNALSLFDYDSVMLRIPAITRLEQYKYILFFEAREQWQDTANVSIGSAIINIDPDTKEVSASDVKAIHKSFTDSESKLRTFMNPCAVKLDNGELVLMYVRRHGLLEHELYIRRSSDDGANWSEFEDISHIFKGQGTPDWSLLCPCSQGLVKRYADNKGRIVFPAWKVDPNYDINTYRAGFIYSDDDGSSWQLGDFTDYAKASETQVAEDLDGSLVFCIRIEVVSNPKVLTRYKDGIYKEIETDVHFTDEPIMSGFIQCENKYDNSNPKFIMTACKSKYRSGLLIHTSYDCKEWQTVEVKELASKNVAYTCVESIDADLKFVLWETNYTKDFVCAVISTKNLIGKGA